MTANDEMVEIRSDKEAIEALLQYLHSVRDRFDVNHSEILRDDRAAAMQAIGWLRAALKVRQ